MSSNPTQRHTARPSRSRVTRARVGAWIDEHDDGITIGAVAVLVVILTALSALILATDYGVSVSHLLGNATLSLFAVTMSAFFAWVVASEKTARRVASVWASERTRERARHERELEKAHAERDDARSAFSASNATLSRVISERDWLSDTVTEVRGERDDMAHLALRMSGIDLPQDMTIGEMSLAVFVAARGEHESCDDMTATDYPSAYDRIAHLAIVSSPRSA